MKASSGTSLHSSTLSSESGRRNTFLALPFACQEKDFAKEAEDKESGATSGWKPAWFFEFQGRFSVLSTTPVPQTFIWALAAALKESFSQFNILSCLCKRGPVSLQSRGGTSAG